MVGIYKNIGFDYNQSYTSWRIIGLLENWVWTEAVFNYN